MTKTFRVYPTSHACVSGQLVCNVDRRCYEEFAGRDEALAFWWGQAKATTPLDATSFWFIHDENGYLLSNAHLRDATVPDHLAAAVALYAQESDDIEADAMGEQAAQSREWRI